jgi:hypothetical protein
MATSHRPWTTTGRVHHELRSNSVNKDADSVCLTGLRLTLRTWHRDLVNQEVGEYFCGIGIELVVAVPGDQCESLFDGDDSDGDAAGGVARRGKP